MLGGDSLLPSFVPLGNGGNSDKEHEDSETRFTQHFRRQAQPTPVAAGRGSRGRPADRGYGQRHCAWRGRRHYDADRHRAVGSSWHPQEAKVRRRTRSGKDSDRVRRTHIGN